MFAKSELGSRFEARQLSSLDKEHALFPSHFIPILMLFMKSFTNKNSPPFKRRERVLQRINEINRFAKTCTNRKIIQVKKRNYFIRC